MDESEGSASRWLHDDHRIIIYTLVSLALIVGGHRTWHEYSKYHENALRRTRILKLVESSKKEKERVGDSQDVVNAGGAAEVRSNEHKTEVSDMETHEVGADGKIHQPQSATAAAAAAAKRSKERRKRGRDVYKEVLKQERKRGKASTRDVSSASSSSVSLLASGQQSNDIYENLKGDTIPVAGPSSVASSSRSRSSSRALTRSDYESSEDTPRPQQEDWATTNQNMSSPSTFTAHLDPLPVDVSASSPSDNNEAGNSSAQDSNDAKPPQEPPSTSCSTSVSSASLSSSSHSMTSSPGASALHLISEGAEASSSNHVIEQVSISQPVPSGPSIKSQASWLNETSSPKASQSRNNNYHSSRPPPSSSSTISLAVSDGSVESESPFPSPGNYRRSKSPPPRFRSKSRTSPLPTMSVLNSNAPTPPPIPPNAPLQAQIASYRGALEAARRREEKARQKEETSRRELERFKTECEMLRMRWNEDAERRKRREFELQQQLYLLMAQVQTMSISPMAKPSVSQMQQPFLPHLPHPPLHQQPNIPGPLPPGTNFPGQPIYPFGYAQNVPPPHQQSFPGASSPPPPSFPYPFLPNGAHPLAQLMNHQHPGSAATSATSSPKLLSPVREFPHASSSSSSLLNGLTSGSTPVGHEQQHDAEEALNAELVEAILKRPQSVRSPSLPTTSGSGSRSASVAGRATKDGFTFASLSELGNPQGYREPIVRDEDGEDAGEDVAVSCLEEESRDSAVSVTTDADAEGQSVGAGIGL